MLDQSDDDEGFIPNKIEIKQKLPQSRKGPASSRLARVNNLLFETKLLNGGVLLWYKLSHAGKSRPRHTKLLMIAPLWEVRIEPRKSGRNVFQQIADILMPNILLTLTTREFSRGIEDSHFRSVRATSPVHSV